MTEQTTKPRVRFRRENWFGSFVELAVQLRQRDDRELTAAVQAAWTSPLLRGPHRTPTNEPPRDLNAVPQVGDSVQWYGVMRVGARWFGCLVGSVREANADWLTVAIPTGMLQLVFHLEQPLDRKHNRWWGAVEKALALVGDHINMVVPFDLAIIGDETLGFYYAAGDGMHGPLTAEIVREAGGFLLSPGLYLRIGVEARPITLQSGLRWIPGKVALWATEAVRQG